MAHYSPLRYPGGKGKFASYIEETIEMNGLLDCTYVEPFCGGSAVALSLLMQGYAKKIILNDFDPVIFAFWDSVINNTEQLVRKIRDTKLSISTWKKCKLIHKNFGDHTNLEIAFATFLLNRVNRSGILKAGIIGGIDQSGPWKMDARYNLPELISRIENIAYKKSRIEVMNLDVIDCIEVIRKRALQKVFLYLDPPYYHKGQELYLNYFSHEDHLRISKYVKSLNFCQWIVSYDNCPEISSLYSFTKSNFYDLNYSAGTTRVRGKEILFCSKKLKLPDFYQQPESPENIKINTK